MISAHNEYFHALYKFSDLVYNIHNRNFRLIGADRAMHIAVCDDNKKDLLAEAEQIKNVFTQKRIKFTLDLYTRSSELINANKQYEIIFLDVQMPDTDGIKTADIIHKNNKNCLIFFVTDFKQYMDDALNKHAFRFWEKPINDAKLVYGIESALKEIDSFSHYIEVTADRKKYNILTKNIICIFHKGRSTVLVTTKGRITTYDSYQSVTEQVNDDFFCSTHSSCCVNFNYVVDYNKTEVICKYNDKIINDAFMSRRKYKLFDTEFKRWIGGAR